MRVFIFCSALCKIDKSKLKININESPGDDVDGTRVKKNLGDHSFLAP